VSWPATKQPGLPGPENVPYQFTITIHNSITIFTHKFAQASAMAGMHAVALGSGIEPRWKLGIAA